MMEVSESGEKPEPYDITYQFENMGVPDFLEFLRSMENQRALAIHTTWENAGTAKRLKAFLEGQVGMRQTREASIRATEKQYMQALNVFASGVEWIKVEE